MMKKRTNSQSGIMMAMVVILFSASILLLTVLLQYVTTISGFSNQIIYRQIAQTAAKSAIEVGKDDFDSSARFDLMDVNNDGVTDNDANSNGVPDSLDEKTMFTNASYKVTYQLAVNASGTSADGRSKTVTGTGKVYLPASATTPRYTRVLNSEIVRSTIVSNDPANFSPLAWYDASCGPLTSTDPGCTLPTVLKSGTANVAANPISMREEQQSNGSHCGGAPTVGGSADTYLSLSKKNECGSIEQRAGLLFNAGAGLPKGTTIQTASIQFKAGAPDTGSPMTLRIRGLLDPNHASFTSANGTQLSPKTTAYVDWSPPSWSTNISYSTADFAPVVQEIINQSGWNTGNNIGFDIECTGTCTGARRALLSPITLNISYAGSSEAVNGDSVQVWRDRSGNGFHLTALDSGSKPTRAKVSQTPGTNDLTNKPMVRFTSGSSAMNASVPLSSGRVANSYTTFAVMSVKKSTGDPSLTGTLSGNGNILSFMGSGTNNWAVVPYWRHPASGAVHTEGSSGYSGDIICQGGAVSVNYVFERQCKSLGLNGSTASMQGPGSDGGGGSNWAILSNRSEIYSVESLFRYHGKNSDPELDTFDPLQLNAPYTIALGYNPRNNVKAAGFEVSEFIVYDHTLSCPQMEAVESYLAAKWGYNDNSLFSNSKYVSTGCRENNVPTF